MFYTTITQPWTFCTELLYWDYTQPSVNNFRPFQGEVTIRSESPRPQTNNNHQSQRLLQDHRQTTTIKVNVCSKTSDKQQPSKSTSAPRPQTNNNHQSQRLLQDHRQTTTIKVNVCSKTTDKQQPSKSTSAPRPQTNNNHQSQRLLQDHRQTTTIKVNVCSVHLTIMDAGCNYN